MFFRTYINGSSTPTWTFVDGAITNPKSMLTRPANTASFAEHQLIASSTAAADIVVPSFTTPGGGRISSIRLLTNATSGWGWVNLSVNLWSAAPTYINGDGGAYAPATGAAGWLANFVIPTLRQFGDGAVGRGNLTSANEMAINGTTIFWDLETLSPVTLIPDQTFTLIAELLN